MKKTLLVVGGGVGGTCLLFHIMRQAPELYRTIIVVDPRAIGTGLAFNHAAPDVLCNTSLGFNSFVPDDPGHPVRWMCTHPDALARWESPVSEIGLDSFIPRGLFLEYVQDVLEQTLHEVEHAGVSVHHHPARASSIRSLAAGVRVVCTDGREIACDDVVVSAGVTIPVEPFPVGEPTSRYLCSPYQGAFAFDALRGCKRLLIVGSRLSAVDAVVLAARTEGVEQITLMSRSGSLPSVRTSMIEHAPHVFTVDAVMASTKASPQRTAQLWRLIVMREIATLYRLAGVARDKPCLLPSDAFEALAIELEWARSSRTPWQDAMAGLVNVANGLWHQLPAGHRPVVKQCLVDLVRRYVTAMPATNAEKLLSLRRAGVLRLLRGPASVRWHSADNTFAVTDRHGNEDRHDGVVNAAGFTMDSSSFPVTVDGTPIGELSGRIDPVNWKVGPPLQAGCDVRGRIYAMGPAIGQALPVTNYLNATVRQAATIARHLNAPLVGHIDQRLPAFAL
jgi:uncharacterized NAD(P)/FAD-binding protein YdhS